MKILWLDINASFSHASLALPAIEAQNAVYQKELEWVVVSGNLKTNVSEIVAEIQRHSPEVIAYTAWLFTHPMLLEILARVKTLLPQTILIGGGPEYSGDNESYLRKNNYIDYLVRGEGEEVFYQWIDFIAGKGSGNIPGLCYLTPEGRYIDNGKARVAQFETLEWPENSRFFNWEKPFVQIETSRGCFNSCAFCVSGNDKPVRNLSLETIRKRLEKVQEKGIRDIRILDRTFNGNPARAIGLLDLFETFQTMRFHLEIHPSLLTNEVKERLSQIPAGKLHLEAGIQSLEERVLDTCGRKGGITAALEGLRFLCGLPHIETHTDLIAGLPGYTLEQIYSDVETLAAVGAREIQLETLKLLPGTAMRQKAAELGIRFSPLPPYEVLQTDAATASQLLTAVALSRILDFYYNARNWHTFFRKITTKELLKKLVGYLEGMTDQPLSDEKKGMLLYGFLCKEAPELLTDFRIVWITNGLSLKKEPVKELLVSCKEPGADVLTIHGSRTEQMRWYCLEDDTASYFFGFDRSLLHHSPAFIGKKSDK